MEKSKFRPLTLILWGEYMDEASVVTFAAEMRRQGVWVKIVSTLPQANAGMFGIRLEPDLSLPELESLTHNVTFMVIPGAVSRLPIRRHQPSLWEMLEHLKQTGVRFVCCESDSVLCTEELGWDLFSTYPCNTGDEGLVSYARHLAHMIDQAVSSKQNGTTRNPSAVPSTNSSDRHGRDRTIRIAATSYPQRVAGAIAGQVREVREAELQAIGVSAINNAMKAIVIARSYLVNDKLDVTIVPSFVEVLIDQEPRTALRLSVKSVDL